MFFISCPSNYSFEDAKWFHTYDEAYESSLQWSVELSGKEVLIYEVVENEADENEFHILCSVFA